jgi:hypothetical protein
LLPHARQRHPIFGLELAVLSCLIHAHTLRGGCCTSDLRPPPDHILRSHIAHSGHFEGICFRRIVILNL